MARSIHTLDTLVTAGQPLQGADAALILIHGRGATAQSIVPLADALDAHDFAVLAPTAHANRWYPYPFMAPKENNEPDLSSALSLIGELVDRVNAAGIPTARIIIAGFSQGACLASEFVALHPQRYGGLLVFSGGMIGTGPDLSGDDYQGSLKGTPVFIGCSDVDGHVPLARVQQTTAVLSALGADVTERIYPGMAHTIIDDEIMYAKTIVQTVRGKTTA